jgi:hypothetical protein
MSWCETGEVGQAMTPNKQVAMGIGGCVLVPGPGAYRLTNGTWTHKLAVTVSLLRAEPSLRRLSEGIPIGCAEAAAEGYKLVRRYDDAVMYGLA